MIKNYLRCSLSAAALILAGLISFCGGSELSNEQPAPKKNLLTAFMEEGMRYELTYDNQNRLIRISTSPSKTLTNTVDFVYDNMKRLIEVRHNSYFPEGEIGDDVTYYAYSGDTIFRTYSEQTPPDTLIVINNKIRQMKQKGYTSAYTYDAKDNLVEITKKSRESPKYHTITFTYNDQKGLLFDAIVPEWYFASENYFYHIFSKNLCTEIKHQNNLKQEKNTFVYQHAGGMPAKATKIENYRAYSYVKEYSLEYKTK